MTHPPHSKEKGFTPEDDQGRPLVPEPFYYGLFPWLWLRFTGYRDEYGRKAQLLKPWEA